MATVISFDEAAGWVDVRMEDGKIQRLPISAVRHPDAIHPSAYYDPSAPSPPSSPLSSSREITYPPPPPAGQVYAIHLPCVGDKRTDPATYKHMTIPTSHDIFFERPTPVSAAIDFPLVIYKTYSLPSVSTPKHLLDNEIATTLNIEPSTGLAPKEWQSRVGTVIVARKDKKSLDMRHFEGVWMYIDMIGNKYKLDGTTESGLREKGMLTRADLVHWWKAYEKQARNSRASYREMNAGVKPADKAGADDWAAVPPLF